MPINESIIEEAVERYQRERDRYEKLTRTVEQICNERIREGSALRVNITARTKSPASFGRKLRRFMVRGEKKGWHSVEDIFAGLSDFSGVRIAFYMAGDEKAILDTLKELFSLAGDFDVKDKRGGNNPEWSNYRAVHCQVALSEEHLLGSNENLRDQSCEIQVCSMMSHVWNEIEHDIGYKPSGTISEQEKFFLATLARNVRDGDLVIQQLMDAHTSRVRGEDLIGSPEELVLFLAELFAVRRVTFRDSVGRVYDSLQRIDLCSKTSLCRSIDLSLDEPESARQARWRKAKADTSAFNRWLASEGEVEHILAARNSVEPLLLLILHRRYKSILQMLPAGRGKGRPVWIRSLASRYREALLSGRTKFTRGSRGSV